MKWLKMGVVVLLVLVAAVLILASTKPDNFRVARSAQIKAPPEKIMALISDFHKWNAWSPYENLDPAMKRTFSGAPSGKGAVYEWNGEDKVGSGRMEILQSSVPQIDIKLDFIKPFEGHNMAVFTTQPQGDMTTVTWAMSGPAPFVSKIMQVFCNLDTIIGKDFEVGLQNLKAVSEK
ncbi:MAG: hypothetical protein JWN23_3384 [Rhodocyclales bacterium]|nr:hypothetical protein [Rhodocyclales bacterium]